MSELSEIGAQTAAIFKKTLIEVMTRLIQKKKSLDDTLLFLCHSFIESEEKNAGFEESELFKEAIIKTSTSVIQAKDPDKKDWFWMKNVIVPSNVKRLYSMRMSA